MRLLRSQYLEVLKLFPEDADLITANSLVEFDTVKSARSACGSSRKSASVAGMAPCQHLCTSGICTARC